MKLVHLGDPKSEQAYFLFALVHNLLGILCTAGPSSADHL